MALEKAVPKAGERAFGKASRQSRMFQKVRRDLKMTQAEMSFVLGVSQVYVGHVEAGRRKPSEKICLLLRNLAFMQRLPYAAAVFDELPERLLERCPRCGFEREVAAI